MTTSISAGTLFNRLMAGTRLRHLQLVLQVAELGSVQQAASRLNVSQSTATKLLADVERVLNTSLFERHARGMRPTFACRDLLPLLRNVMAMLTNCAETAAAAGAGIEGTVRVGAITAGMTGLLNPVLPGFLSTQPQVRVELFEDALPTLLGRYADGELDMLVTRAPAQLATDSQFVPLMEDECVIAVRPDHPLVGQRRLRAAQLRDYPWANPPLHSQAYSAFEAFFGEGGLPARQPLSTRSLSTIVHYLRASDALLMGSLSFMRGALDAQWITRLDCLLREQLPPLGLTFRTDPRNRSIAALQAYLIQS